MHLLRRNHHFEYRDQCGLDRWGRVDVWTNQSGARAVLVMRDIPVAAAPDALRTLHYTWLPYLLPARAEVVVLTLRPKGPGEKARAVVLHSA